MVDLTLQITIRVAPTPPVSVTKLSARAASQVVPVLALERSTVLLDAANFSKMLHHATVLCVLCHHMRP
jgi:hypothetical protein